MGNSGSGGRTDWKEKLGQSSWVDDTPWVDAGSSEETSVEFLETEPSAFRLSRPTPEASESLLTPQSSRFLLLAAIGVVLVAIAIMSRPGSDDPFDQLPTAQQQEILERRQQQDGTASLEDDDAATDLTDGAESAAQTGVEDGGTEDGAATAAEEAAAPVEPLPLPPPIPSLRSDLPAELAGALHITGVDSSLVSVRWAEGEITESWFPDRGSEAAEVQALQVIGGEIIMYNGQLLQATPDGEIAGSAADINGLLPTNSGLTLSAPGPDGARSVYVLPAPGREPPEPVEQWIVDHDFELLGRWDDRLLVTKAGRVWLFNPVAETSAAVTDGQVLSYDGRHLVMLRCGDLTDCRIEVGTPDQPARSVIAVPESLTGRNASSWGTSATVSPDATRLAIVDDVGAFSAPLSIDLASGTVTVGSDIVNGDSPFAWSPDGRFLAYAFGDDLVLWDRELDDRYRIDIDRQIDLMVWAGDPEEG